jgi:hypothetical protein
MPSGRKKYFLIGIYTSKYFLGPRNSSWGSQSREEGPQAHAVRHVADESARAIRFIVLKNGIQVLI